MAEPELKQTRSENITYLDWSSLEWNFLKYWAVMTVISEYGLYKIYRSIDTKFIR